jgi:hypothetical protein
MLYNIKLKRLLIINLTATMPGFSAEGAKEEGCWSEEA